MKAYHSVVKERTPQIDILRGVAIIFMSYFHLLFDLKEFYGYNINYKNFSIGWTGSISALLFILLAGYSSSLSKNNLRRAAKILFFAMLISIVTFFLFEKDFIRFGILHLLGASIITAPILKRFPISVLFPLSFAFISAGLIVKNYTLSHSAFFAFGLVSSDFSSLDYYPLLPYYGVYVIGFVLSNVLPPSKLKPLNKRNYLEPLEFLGRHSLAIYLLHQPVLLALLYLLHLPG